MAYVLSLNLHRRHLTTSQRAMVGARARDIYDRDRKEAQKAAVIRGNKTRHGKPAPVVAISPQLGKARDDVGRAVNVGGKTIDAATRVLKKGTPELIAAVDAGEMSAYTAARKIDNPEPEEESGAG